MTEFEWRQKYAPNGYRFREAFIDFSEYYKDAGRPVYWKRYIAYAIMALHASLGNPHVYYTKIQLHPLQVGESLNCHDPLVLRYGLRIEMRVAEGWVD